MAPIVTYRTASGDERIAAIVEIEYQHNNNKVPARYFVIHKDQEAREAVWVSAADVISKGTSTQFDEVLSQFMYHKGTNFETVHFGRSSLRPWYFSPYPGICPSPNLYVCPFCFAFTQEQSAYELHRKCCVQTFPPGEEIWRSTQKSQTFSIFEIDGSISKNYCQNLCLFTRLYLEHKEVSQETDVFLFYVLCVHDAYRCRPVGFFSKERSDSPNILSCILCFPHFQKKGYGHLLIDAAYGMNIVALRPGGPEEPLSDFGKVSFMSYWSYRIFRYIAEHDSEEINVHDIRQATGISLNHIVATLLHHKVIGLSSDGEYVAARGERLCNLCDKALIKASRVFDFMKDPNYFSPVSIKEIIFVNKNV